MSNGILSKENEEHSLKMLAAQSILYDIAKRFTFVVVLFSVVLPLILSVVEFFITNTGIQTVIYSISICSIIISFFLNKQVKKKKELAALIQQKFDVYVYNMPWNISLFGRDKNVDYEIEKYCRKIIDNPKKKEDLKNWYTASIDDKELLDGILSCQRTNCFWDIELRKRYRALIMIISGLICAAIIVPSLMFKETLLDVIARIFFVTPIFSWVSDTVVQLNEDIEELSEIDDVLKDTSEKQMDDLQQIQRMLYEHRKSCYKIPSIFYRLFKNHDEDLMHGTFSN